MPGGRGLKEDGTTRLGTGGSGCWKPSANEYWIRLPPSHVENLMSRMVDGDGSPLFLMILGVRVENQSEQSQDGK